MTQVKLLEIKKYMIFKINNTLDGINREQMLF